MVLIVTVVTGLSDEFPMLSTNACVRLLTTCVVATLLFLAGLACTTQVGNCWLRCSNMFIVVAAIAVNARLCRNQCCFTLHHPFTVSVVTCQLARDWPIWLSNSVACSFLSCSHCLLLCCKYLWSCSSMNFVIMEINKPLKIIRFNVEFFFRRDDSSLSYRVFLEDFCCIRVSVVADVHDLRKFCSLQ